MDSCGTLAVVTLHVGTGRMAFMGYLPEAGGGPFGYRRIIKLIRVSSWIFMLPNANTGLINPPLEGRRYLLNHP